MKVNLQVPPLKAAFLPPFSLCEVQPCVGRLTAQTETLTGSVKPLPTPHPHSQQPPRLPPALSSRLSVFFKADNADVKLLSWSSCWPHLWFYLCAFVYEGNETMDSAEWSGGNIKRPEYFFLYFFFFFERLFVDGKRNAMGRGGK